MDRKCMILTCLFSVLTLISSIICSSLVFYNEKARTEINSEEVLAANNIYKNSTITYEQNNNVKLSGLTPGFSMQQSFSVTNNNSNTIKYNVEWTNVVSTWAENTDGMQARPEEFIYSISCSNGDKVENKKMPISEKDYMIFENVELKTNNTNTCTITITFLETGLDQTYNLGKSFGGTYKVLIKE